MRVTNHPLAGVKIIELEPRADARGAFVRVWDKALFAGHGLAFDWQQENQALSVKTHTLRGLHFQRPPHAETKLVRCVQGRMLDVFLDLRKNSPTFGKAGAVELDSAAPKMVLVPRGFAHGYITLSDNCIAGYKVDAAYAPDAEGGVLWNDPALGIKWPTQAPVLSDKDKTWPMLKDVRPLDIE